METTRNKTTKNMLTSLENHVFGIQGNVSKIDQHVSKIDNLQTNFGSMKSNFDSTQVDITNTNNHPHRGHDQFFFQRMFYQWSEGGGSSASPDESPNYLVGGSSMS
jgi:hypothetical protein